MARGKDKIWMKRAAGIIGREDTMNARYAAYWLIVAAVFLAGSNITLAQTCADQHRACLERKHTQAECKASTDRCEQTGRWIGPAGIEYPISKKK